MFLTKRVYEAADKADGARVLVDRLWPRGLSRETAKIDLWLKDIAPDEDLRKWFSHRDDRWEEFRIRYRMELDGKGDAVRQLLDLGSHRRVTLLYAAHDTEHNNARVLLEYLREQEQEESRRETAGTTG